MVALDTNILVYAHRAGDARHRRAVSIVRHASQHPRGWGMALPVVAEFWRVVTHPRAPGGAATFDQADGFLQALADAGAACWQPLPGFDRRLIAWAGRLGVTDRGIFDLQIGLMAQEAGATRLLSHDREFITVPGLELLDPFGE
ncbi:MAG TPA: PIN domain-containing protein [Terriglobales bacterium]